MEGVAEGGRGGGEAWTEEEGEEEEVVLKEEVQEVEGMAAEGRPLSSPFSPDPLLLLLLLLLLSVAASAVAYLACIFQGTRAS